MINMIKPLIVGLNPYRQTYSSSLPSVFFVLNVINLKQQGANSPVNSQTGSYLGGGRFSKRGSCFVIVSQRANPNPPTRVRNESNCSKFKPADGDISIKPPSGTESITPVTVGPLRHMQEMRKFHCLKFYNMDPPVYRLCDFCHSFCAILLYKLYPQFLLNLRWIINVSDEIHDKHEIF